MTNGNEQFHIVESADGKRFLATTFPLSGGEVDIARPVNSGNAVIEAWRSDQEDVDPELLIVCMQTPMESDQCGFEEGENQFYIYFEIPPNSNLDVIQTLAAALVDEICESV